MNSNFNFEQILTLAMNEWNNISDEIAKYKFQLLYPFTTENITGYINNFNLYQNALLTVGSSGDQMINASLFDCQDIVCLDICRYTKYYIYLKISCLLELNQNEFLTFLCSKVSRNKQLLFSNEIYKKIKSTLRVLDYESYLFWDELFANFKGIDIRKKLFYLDEYNVKTIRKCNPYLQSNILYEEAAKKIVKTRLRFMNGDIFKTNIEEQFDSIWLSNIGTCISRHFLKIMVDKVVPNLKENGSLLISYLYNFIKDTKYQQDWCPIYNLKRTMEILQEYSPEMISFEGVKNNQKDSILIYKKR